MGGGGGRWGVTGGGGMGGHGGAWGGFRGESRYREPCEHQRLLFGGAERAHTDPRRQPRVGRGRGGGGLAQQGLLGRQNVRRRVRRAEGEDDEKGGGGGTPGPGVIVYLSYTNRIPSYT